MHKKLGIAAGIAGSLFAVQQAEAADSYVIKSGDTLSEIANTHQLKISSLIEANPQIKNPNLIFPGHQITIPASDVKAMEIKEPKVAEPKEQYKPQIITTAEKYLGAKFLYGASMHRTDAFDCSSFTKRVFQENGYNIPRVSRFQANAGTAVSLKQAQVGDLVFYDTNFDGVINHVGIYAGNSKMIHVSSSRGVRYSDITRAYWRTRYVKTVRFL